MKMQRPEYDVPWYACDWKDSKSIEKIMGVATDSDGSGGNRSSRNSQAKGGDERVSVQFKELESRNKESDSVRERRDEENALREPDEDTESGMSSDNERSHVTVEVDVHQKVVPRDDDSSDGTYNVGAPSFDDNVNHYPRGAPTSTAVTATHATPQVSSGHASRKFAPVITSTLKPTNARPQLLAFRQRRERMSATIDRLLSKEVPSWPQLHQREEQIRPTPKPRGREWYTPAQHWDELALMDTAGRNNPAGNIDIDVVNLDRSHNREAK